VAVVAALWRVRWSEWEIERAEGKKMSWQGLGMFGLAVGAAVALGGGYIYRMLI
jgi:hypothetical protein